MITKGIIVVKYQVLKNKDKINSNNYLKGKNT